MVLATAVRAQHTNTGWWIAQGAGRVGTTHRTIGMRQFDQRRVERKIRAIVGSQAAHKKIDGYALCTGEPRDDWSKCLGVGRKYREVREAKPLAQLDDLISNRVNAANQVTRRGQRVVHGARPPRSDAFRRAWDVIRAAARSMARTVCLGAIWLPDTMADAARSVIEF